MKGFFGLRGDAAKLVKMLFSQWFPQLPRRILIVACDIWATDTIAISLCFDILSMEQVKCCDSNLINCILKTGLPATSTTLWQAGWPPTGSTVASFPGKWDQISCYRFWAPWCIASDCDELWNLHLLVHGVSKVIIALFAGKLSQWVLSLVTLPLSRLFDDQMDIRLTCMNYVIFDSDISRPCFYQLQFLLVRPVALGHVFKWITGVF